MKIESLVHSLLFIYVPLLAVGTIFIFIENRLFTGELRLNIWILYVLFIITLFITLGSVDFSKRSIKWERPAFVSLALAIGTFLVEKDLI